MTAPKPSAKADKPADANAPAGKQELTFTELELLKPADLAVHAAAIPALDKAVEKAREKFTGGLKYAAKVVAAMKRQYIARLNAREIPPDTGFKDYFEANARGKLPGRVEALAVLFNTLVLTLDARGKALLSEENYDAAKVDWLEKANATVSAARKLHGEDWKTCDDVLDTVNALSKPGDAARTLKEVRERQKQAKGADGETGENAGATVVPLTVGRCVEFLIAAIKTANAMPPETAQALFFDTLALGDAWAQSGISDDTLNDWNAQAVQNAALGVAPGVEVKTSVAA